MLQSKGTAHTAARARRVRSPSGDDKLGAPVQHLRFNFSVRDGHHMRRVLLLQAVVAPNLASHQGL